MRIRKAIQLTVVVVVVVVAILVLSWYRPGCAPSPTADITFTIALDRNGSVGTAYDIRYIPATLLIDKEGIVRGREVGPFGSQEALLSWLDDLTSSEPEPPPSGVAPIVGHVAPDLTLPTLDGGTVELSQLRGKWVLLTFWTTRCGGCLILMPYLQAAFEEKGGEIEFIGINLRESEERVRRYVEG
jgi:peroxiredoxin